MLLQERHASCSLFPDLERAIQLHLPNGRDRPHISDLLQGLEQREFEVFVLTIGDGEQGVHLIRIDRGCMAGKDPWKQLEKRLLCYFAYRGVVVSKRDSQDSHGAR